MYVFNDRINCNTCKHNYLKERGDGKAICDLCGAGYCMICAEIVKKCLGYEPKGVKKDENSEIDN